jgi:hypothetical protein
VNRHHLGFNAHARATNQRLADAFGLRQPHDTPSRGGRVTMGLEVEVPWSSFFPELWERYGLADRKVYSLPAAKLSELNAECAALEFELLPKLRKTVECGIPRGNDRYWEYAFRPVTEGALVVEQVSLLTAAGLLPRDKPHALHVTVGDIPRCTALYYLSMLLEAEFVEPARIRQAVALMGRKIHTGWGRKGTAGIFEKDACELQGGAAVASEIRLLQLPSTDHDFSRLMAAVQWAVNAIQDRRQGVHSPQALQWAGFEARAASVLASQGLANANWFLSGPGGGIDHAAWERYGDRLDAIRADLVEGLPPGLERELQPRAGDDFEGEAEAQACDRCREANR